MLPPSLLRAQSNVADGALRGSVTDVSGAVVTGAKVTATMAATGASYSAATGNDGEYRFLILPPGDYEVKFEKEAFGVDLVKGVRVTVGETVTLDQRLRISPAREVLEVNARASSVERERSHQANTLEREPIENLPIDRRDFLTFALLAPGVVDSTALADNMDFRVKQSPTSGLSFYGNNGRGNSVTLDGGEMNDLGGGVRSTVSQEAVQEFQINRSNYSAEVGNASGGVVNIVSKSGTNRLQGSLFGFFRHDRLDSADPFARILENGRMVRTKPPSHREQFGGSMGGPVRKDRTFFFLSMEGLIRNESNAVSLLTDPSIFGLTATQTAILNGLPAPAAAQLRSILQAPPSTIKLFENNSGVFPYTTHNWLFSTRLDHRFNDRDSIFVRFGYGNLHETDANLQALLGATRGIRADLFDPTAILKWTHIFSDHAINEAHLQTNYRNSGFASVEPYGPEIRILGYGVFNRDPNLPARNIENRQEFTDSFSYVRGAHTWKMGGQILVRGIHADDDVFFGGRFVFGELPGSLLNPALPPEFTITSLQAFNLRLAETYFEGFGDGVVSSVNPYYSAFVQDSWKVRRDLTLELGLRYDLDTRYAPVPTDKNNVAPRIAFAWQPGGKTLVRGGYGIFYSPTYYQIDYISHALGVSPSGERPIAQVFTSILTPGPSAANNVFSTLVQQGVIGLPTPRRAINPADLAQFGLAFTHTGPIPPFSGIFRVASNYVNPYSQQASLQIERELTPNLAVSASYTYIHTLKLTRSRDINLLPAPVDSKLGIPVWSSPADFVDPNIGALVLYESSGKAAYSGMILELRKRLSHSFSLNANYTLSHATDDVTDYSLDYEASNQTDSNAEHGPSSFDQRHKFVAYALWSVPGKVRLSPVFRANSGRPFNLLVGYDLNQDRHDTNDRPAFAGRNTGIGPGFWTFDLRMARDFRLSEASRLELVAEGFDLFNHLNFSSVNNTVGNIPGPFNVRGMASRSPSDPLGFTSASPGRRIQLGVRIKF
jgi:hypothetical protein